MFININHNLNINQGTFSIILYKNTVCTTAFDIILDFSGTIFQSLLFLLIVVVVVDVDVDVDVFSPEGVGSGCTGSSWTAAVEKAAKS